MIVFGLIFVVGAIACALALVLGRPLLGRAATLRLVSASHSTVFAGVREYLRIHERALLASGGLVAVAVFVGAGAVRAHAPSDPVSSSWAMAAWITAALLTGAVSTTLATRVAAHAAARCSPRVAEAANHGADHALREGIHAASAATLAACAVLLVGLASLTLAAFASAGGLNDDEAGGNAANTMAQLITAYAFGTVLASVVAHTIGGVFVSAAPSVDPHNANVGAHLDVAVSRVADLFATLATALIAGTVIFGSVASRSSTAAHSPLAITLGPLVALAFCVLSSTVGLLVVRTDSTEQVGASVDRGLVVTLVLGTASFVGLTHWLFGESWWRMLIAPCAGLLGAALLLWSERVFGTRKRAAPHDTRQHLVGAWGFGLQRAASTVFVAGTVAVGGYFAGHGSGLAHGGSVGLVLATLGVLTPAPFVLATSTFGTLVDRWLDLDPDEGRNRNAERRLLSATFGLSGARAFAAVGTAMAAWVAVPALAYLARGAGSDGEQAALRLGGPAVSALLGTALVFWIAGANIRAVASVLRGSHADEPTDDADAMSMQSAAVASMSAARRVSATLQESVRQGVPLILVVTLAPALIFALIRLTAGGGSSGTLVTSTASLLLGASLAGLALSVASESIGNYWTTKNRNVTGTIEHKPVDVTKKWAKNLPDGAAVVGDTLGSPLQSLVGPSIHALVKLLATAALAFAPLFF